MKRCLLPHLLALAALTVVAGCTAPETPEQPVVATVGDQAIAAEDFARSFELGFPHLKRGADARRAYLDRMVDEKLLALEGYRLRLDTTGAVRAQVADLLDELLVEHIFEREVNAHVSVTDAEIEEALQQEAVRFRVRYVPAGTAAEAAQVRAVRLRDGFDAALAEHLARHPETPFQPADFVTPYLTAAEVPPEILDGLRDLPMGEPSEPLLVGGQYVVAEVVDVQREPVALDPAARSRVRQALFQQKAKRQARTFVTTRMEPLEVRIRAGAFRDLTAALWAWYPTLDGPPLRLSDALAADASPEAEAVRVLRSTVLATTRDSTLTVGDLLDAYPARRYALSTKTREGFQGDLYDAIGLTLRDASFVAQARAEGLAEAPAVRADLDRWRDKWVYQALIAHLADTVTVTEADVAEYRARHAAYYDALDLADAERAERLRADIRTAKVRAALPELLAALRERHAVTIHDDALEAAVPAAQVTPGLPVTLFKAHTGRPLYPTVDPAW